jgi:anthranilate synthase component II
LGVCLGHQTIAAAFGAKVVRANVPMHGRTSQIIHGGEGIFRGLESPLVVGRYHSLVVSEETMPVELEVTARTEDRVVMALAHRRWPVYGVQFHPESILTEQGYALLANFLRLASIKTEDLPTMSNERPPAADVISVPAGPVTF